MKGGFYMKEQWKCLVGFPNYCISNKGRVKNAKTNKVLKQQHRGSQ